MTLREYWETCLSECGCDLQHNAEDAIQVTDCDQLVSLAYGYLEAHEAFEDAINFYSAEMFEKYDDDA